MKRGKGEKHVLVTFERRTTQLQLTSWSPTSQSSNRPLITLIIPIIIDSNMQASNHSANELIPAHKVLKHIFPYLHLRGVEKKKRTPWTPGGCRWKITDAPCLISPRHHFFPCSLDANGFLCKGRALTKSCLTLHLHKPGFKAAAYKCHAI